MDPVFEEDDISSLGHSELDQHRELRSMIRTAAWEMPLLSALAKPFEPPKKTEIPLRWRYTSYMGEVHPAQSKVVVEFDPHDIKDMNHEQRQKLRKLAGTRYNHAKSKVKMSCESFETQAQNKRYLGDVIKTLITEARDLSTETFADIPLDTRHLKSKAKPRFPTSWLLTEERKAELEGLRRTQLLEEGAKVEQDLLVSGVAAIEAARQIQLKAVEEPVMVEARQPLAKGKQGRKEMGQTRGAQRVRGMSTMSRTFGAAGV
ncbi:37S ribosomal protein S24, mitochondrial [Recurvomyces mirabilis]|uniref:37S ribosomal protein S24, mitochondrial n=1 Tax=Recurvomyces mirabilis TaxID=574656 RepID=A0AAE1C5I9_9PEZI|nr:37S ribosomal protein S24, mitochondrial [Recurvomyces mirabilis]